MHSSISTSDAVRHLALVAGTVLIGLFCSVVAGAIRFDETMAGHSRVFNVRLVPDSYRAPLMDAFIATASTANSKPLIVVLGDSQSWGFRQREERVFSTLLQKKLPHYRVLNLSVVDGRLKDQLAILEMLDARGIRPKLILSSTNLAHVKNTEMQRLPKTALPSWAYFLSPLNVVRIGEFAPPSDREPSEMAYKRFQVPDRFVDSKQGLEKSAELLERTLRRARDIAEHVYFYMPPHAVDDFASYNYDRALYDGQVRDLIAACATTGAICDDLSSSLPLKAFQDVVHLNRSGHEKMAAALLPSILNVIEPPQVASR